MKPNREPLMAALSAAEHLVSLAPVEPYEILLAHITGTPCTVTGVRMYFHQDPAALRAFAAVVGVETDARPHTDKPGSDLYTFARGEFDGAPFLAWTLTDAPKVSLVRKPAEPVAVCHDAELRAGHPSEAHELDDDSVFVTLAPGYTTGPAPRRSGLTPAMTEALTGAAHRPDGRLDGLPIVAAALAARGYVVQDRGPYAYLTAEGFAAAAELKSSPSCGRCRCRFNPDDTRHDGAARHGDSPWCRGCVDRCHESTDFAHACPVCAPAPVVSA